MKRTMRIYESGCGLESVFVLAEDGTCFADRHDDYFPTSEPFEVDVTMLPVEEVTEKRIGNLEAAKAEAHANWLTIQASFDDKIAKLRALPHLDES